MTDTEKKIIEIREVLKKATQGPWKWIDPGGIEKKKLVGEWEIMNFGIGGGYDQVAGDEPDEEDAHLIANAPEWLRWAVGEIERLRAALEMAQSELRWGDPTNAIERVERIIDEALSTTTESINAEKVERIECPCCGCGISINAPEGDGNDA